MTQLVFCNLKLLIISFNQFHRFIVDGPVCCGAVVGACVNWRMMKARNEREE
jgi:hypothetical protein